MGKGETEENLALTGIENGPSPWDDGGRVRT